MYNGYGSVLSTVPIRLTRVISPTRTKRVSKMLRAERKKTCSISFVALTLLDITCLIFLVFSRKWTPP